MGQSSQSITSDSRWQRRFWPMLLVFIAGACVMIIEIVAARLVARHVGASLYTWTSIIGVVLAGLTLGNYLGGLISDRLDESRVSRAVSLMFLASSILCLALLWLHWLVFDLPFTLSWPMKILLGTTLAFFLPAVALGAISPVVAKCAVVHSSHVGETLGELYAFGSLGSIFGTLIAGFVLIPLMGSSLIIGLVAVLLALVALDLNRRVPNLLWLVFAVAVTLLMAQNQGWARNLQQNIGLSSTQQPVYTAESAYQTIEVHRSQSGVHTVKLDDLHHGYIDPLNPQNLIYPYLDVYRLVFDIATAETRFRQPRALMLGGGAYSFPRYLQAARPFASSVVIEIDEKVTQANQIAAGLEVNPGFEIIHLDARQATSDLKARGDKFDFIFADAFRSVSIPFHLATYEYHVALKDLLNDNGVIVTNLIDRFKYARFLGAYINTVSSLFEHVYLIGNKPFLDDQIQDTFVVIASDRALSPHALKHQIRKSHFALYLADENVMAALRERSRGLVLTDEFAPVENLLAEWMQDTW